MKRRYISTASGAGADRSGVSPRSANEARCDVNTTPADEDPNTTPLPVLSQFFTWAPGDEPAPYDPPRTSAETRRLQGLSSHPVIDVVPRPAAAHQPAHRRRWLVAVSVMAVVAAAAVVLWPERSSTDQPSPPTTVPAPARVDPRLASLMPTDYPAGACTPVPADNRSAAECGPNISAPNTSSRFTLYQDVDALDAALAQFISGTTVLVCPGNYQSPGPWRRRAAPDVPVGTLVCGTSPQGHARIGWTVDSELLLASIESSPGGPTLPQLYDWWSKHS